MESKMTKQTLAEQVESLRLFAESIKTKHNERRVYWEARTANRINGIAEKIKLLTGEAVKATPAFRPADEESPALREFVRLQEERA